MCALPTPPAVWIRRRRRRRRDRLMMVACVLEILDLDDEEVVVGRTIGSTNIRRTRKKVKDMWKELGCYARKAYRMNMDSLKKLHSLLLPALRDEFDIKERSRGKTPNGNISTLLRLSAAIRFFAGGSVYDIMLSHGMGKQSVYKSVYGVVNAVNATAALAFNDNGAEFPSHEEQTQIADGFRAMSAADFDKIILTLDGMLVWTTQPSAAECELIEIGERLFHCYRKDKFGFLLMAGCDHETRFRWADIKHPASTSDYLAWTNTDVGIELENDDSDLILPDHVIAGDNAFVENMTMATPIPGTQITDVEDAYNFYLSQVRITIERAFGILVHRWGVLRRPLSMSILKVPSIVICLMRLHNFCIDNGDSRRTPTPRSRDERHIRRRAATQRTRDDERQAAVSLDSNGIPSALVGSGHHFRDAPRGRRPRRNNNDLTPMRKMIRKVADADLRRPAF